MTPRASFEETPEQLAGAAVASPRSKPKVLFRRDVKSKEPIPRKIESPENAKKKRLSKNTHDRIRNHPPINYRNVARSGHS